MRLLMSTIIILLTVSACALGTETASEIELTVIPAEETDESFDAMSVPVNELTEEAQPTATLISTLTPLPPQPTHTPESQSIQSTENCTIRSDLPTYTVVAGDTLSSIATRFGTTATQLSTFNCLTDANLIRSGMQLYVPAIAESQSNQVTDATETIGLAGVQGALRVSPSVADTHPVKGTVYILPVETSVTIDWTGIDPDYFNDIISVVFSLIQPRGTITEIGTDTDISNGIAITWLVPAHISGSIIASARTGNNVVIDAPYLPIEAEFTPLESSLDTGSQDLGIRGTLRVYPAIESGNVSDWNDYVIEPETPFTVDWTGIEPEYYYDLVRAEFFYIPDNGLRQLIGTDNNLADNMAVTWTPPAGVSGSITAVTYRADGAYWRSSTLHIREPEETTNTEDGGCQFTLSETADAYENPHTLTTIVATDVSAGQTFTVIGLTVVDSGTFVQVEVSDGVEGWVSGGHGSVTCPGG